MSSKDTPHQELLVDTREAATMLSKHPAVLADWRHQNRGPKYVKFGRSIRYRIGDLHAWIADHTIEPAAKRPDVLDALMEAAH
jgi:predicted DNA-binding transcriptional regulator AlpA